MKFVVTLSLAAAFVALALASCKTTEENYRQAYEKTIAARQQAEPIDSTVYGRVRNQAAVRTVETASGRVRIESRLVRVADGCGLPEQLKRYNAVAGQFKQLFNAKSLRNRIADNGYPGAIVVETSEPYFYVVAASFADIEQAAACVAQLQNEAPAWLKEPCPFVLDATARKNYR